MLLYHTASGPIVTDASRQCAINDQTWAELINRDDLHAVLAAALDSPLAASRDDADAQQPPADLLPPIGAQQELWAAGVTYFRSRTARMEESQTAGGGQFYDRVYNADRPELFLKATPHRVVAHGQPMRLRADSKWMVPEPELTLVVTANAKIVGYTIGNDLSCRDIEGENPLYLPQAKTFDGCAALGPGVLVTDQPLDASTAIRITISRSGETVIDDATDLSQLKRTPAELVEYLFRACSFPNGCLLMTGTGIVPPDEFALKNGDAVSIEIEGIGTLRNTVV